MTSYRGNRCGVLALLLLGCTTACRHKAPPPPPAASAPPITPSSITVITPLPSVPTQSKADVKPAATPEPPPPAPAPAASPKQPSRRARRKQIAPSTPASKPEAVPTSAPAPTTTPTQGSEAASASVAKEAEPAIGQLSAGTAINETERTRMLSAIQQQEARLAKLKASATSEILTLQMQAKTFLTKARQAIAENDLDGAQTLNTKARVLLDELQPE